MKRTSNWKDDLDLTGKCETCKYYLQMIVRGKITARGTCILKGGVYQQRTDTCNRYSSNKQVNHITQ